MRRPQAFKVGDNNPNDVLSSENICKREKTDGFSSGKTKLSLTKNSVGNWCLGIKGSFFPTALPLNQGKCCLMINFSNTLKTTGEKCGLKPQTVLLNRLCVIWLRNPIRIQWHSRQVSLLLGALTFEKLLLAEFTKLQALAHGQTRKFVRCRALVLTSLLSGLTGMNN